MQKMCKFIVCLVQKKTLPLHGFRHAGEGLILQLLQLNLAEAQIREVIHTLGALGCHRGSILGFARGVGALRHIGAVAATTACHCADRGHSGHHGARRRDDSRRCGQCRCGHDRRGVRGDVHLRSQPQRWGRWSR